MEKYEKREALSWSKSGKYPAKITATPPLEFVIEICKKLKLQID